MGATLSSARTTRKRQLYRCYLVRCRLEEGTGQPNEPGREDELAREPKASTVGAWRFTVEQVRPDAASRAFTSIQDVAAHIGAELARCENLASRQKNSSHPTHSEVEP